jgi:hypothetical protein
MPTNKSETIGFEKTSPMGGAQISYSMNHPVEDELENIGWIFDLRALEKPLFLPFQRTVHLAV